MSQLDSRQLKQFHDDGYLLVPAMFDAEELDLLLQIGHCDQDLATAGGMRDAQGGVSRLSLRRETRDDIYSAFVHCRRVVERMETLLGGEVYHIHHKMMLKEPRVGGAWEWHQDYGYWYHDAFLFPHMASCLIAVDRATRENGCLQVLRSSHQMGRIDHISWGDKGQRGADPQRVEFAQQHLELVYCEMEPGTALFFHGNLLHRSDANTSPNPRWSLICCYSRADNEPHIQNERSNPKYRFLEKWPDERIKQIGREQLTQLGEPRSAAISRRSFVKATTIAALAMHAGAGLVKSAEQTTSGEPRRITRDAPQIFVDLDDLEPLDNVQQLRHEVEKFPGNPVIAPEKPWERSGGGPAASFIYDDEEKLFKCWYQGVIGDEKPAAGGGYEGYGPHTLNYATSKDGIHWERPNLGLHEVMGTKENNVVIPNTHHDGKDHWESVQKDPFDPEPARRYKGFGWSSKTGGLHTMTSPDGLNWTHSSDQEHVVPGGDAQAMMIDPLKKRYVLFVRSGPRATYESTDFIHWSKPTDSIEWKYPGSVYNHMGFVYGDTYLGWVSWFHADKSDARFPNLDIHLMSSRDGRQFRLVDPERPVVPCGTFGEWDRWMTMLTGAPPIRVGDKLYIYYRGFSRRHKPFGLPEYKDTIEAGGLGLGTLRLDGFASLAAGFDGGRVTTKPIVFDGRKLSINAKANWHAHVRVEVLDVEGQPITYFTAGDCAAMQADRVDAEITWKNRPDLSELAGKPIRLRFHLQNARLYSYRIG